MGVARMSEGEDCRTAFQAALELIREQCGVSFAGGAARRVEVSGTSVLVPKEVSELAEKNPELTREQRISAIAGSEWCLGWGKGMCDLVSPGLTGAAREECISRMARKLAERVV